MELFRKQDIALQQREQLIGVDYLNELMINFRSTQ